MELRVRLAGFEFSHVAKSHQILMFWLKSGCSKTFARIVLWLRRHVEAYLPQNNVPPREMLRFTRHDRKPDARAKRKKVIVEIKTRVVQTGAISHP